MVRMALHHLVLVLFGLFYWVLSAEMDDTIVNTIAKRNGKKIERMMQQQNSLLYNVDVHFENNLSILHVLMKNQILRTVQEEVRPPITLVLAEDEDTDEENADDDDDSGLSIEIENEDELNVDKEHKNIFRWTGGSCSKKAAKICNRACRDAHKFVCTIYKCSKRMKKRVKKECKKSCKRKFSSGKSKYSGRSSEGDFTFERK